MRIAASTCGLWRLWCATGVALIASCTASSEEVRAPQDQIFFPSGLAVSPDGTALFVANANSELRYDSGTLSVIDVAHIDEVLQGWTSAAQTYPTSCERDPDHIETLVCEESDFVRKGAGVRIGNFATDIGIQDFTAQSGGVSLRLFVPTRGDPSISWADFDGERLSCNTSTEAYGLCDDAHRLVSVQNNPDEITIPSEPFNVFADGPNGFAMVSHLSNGAVTLISAPRDSSQVRIVDLLAGVFARDQTTGVSSATGIAGRNVGATGEDGAIGDIVYVGSRTEDRIQTFTVGRLAGEASYLLPGNSFFLDSVGANGGKSFDSRGMQFSPTGDRLYIVNRRPPSLQIFDTSGGNGGFPRNAATGASDICREASTVTTYGDGDAERAYVTCFQDGQIYVVDPRGQSQVEDIISVGRGPYAVVASRGTVGGAARKQLYVSNFLEDTLAVIDIDPASSRHNRVVLRIGKAKTP